MSEAAAGRRAAARRRGVRPRASRGGLRDVRRPCARARVGRVRAARRAQGDPGRANRARRYEDEDWPAERGLSSARPRARPLTGSPPCRRRSRAIRRCRGSSLEGAFLLLVAVLAGLADLAAAWIVLVMAVAWGLVVLTEWAAAAKRSRWRLDEIAPPADAASEPAADTTGPWDMPVVEATVVESGPRPRVEDDRGQAPRGAGGRSRGRSRRRSACALLRRRKPAETRLPILPAIPGRRSLAAAVAAALPRSRCPAPRRCTRAASGAGAEGLLRLRRPRSTRPG